MPTQKNAFRIVPNLRHIRRNIQRAIRRALEQPPAKWNIEWFRLPLRQIERIMIGYSAYFATTYRTDAIRETLRDRFQSSMIWTKHITFCAVRALGDARLSAIAERQHIRQLFNRRIDLMLIRAWHPPIFIFIKAKRHIQHPPHRLSRKSCLRVQSSMQAASCGRYQRDNAINAQHCHRVSEDHSSQAHH